MKRLTQLLILLTIASSCFAQNARKDDVAALSVTQQTSAGTVSFLQPMSGATVTVCTSVGTGTPCNTPLIGLCASATDLVCNRPNPFNADINGNYGFWAPPGRYVVSITQTGTNGKNVTYDLVALSGNNSFTGNNTFPSINQILYVDGVVYKGADLGAGINAAAAACTSPNCWIIVPPQPFSKTVTTSLVLPTATYLQFPPGVFHFSGAQTISNSYVNILGAPGYGTTFVMDSNTADLFDITGGQGFTLRNVQIQPNGTRTAGCVLNATGGSGAGEVREIQLTDPYCGFKLATSGGPANQWVFDTIFIHTSGGNWNSLFTIGGVSSGTVTSNSISNVIGTVCTTGISGPLLTIDSGVDALNIWKWNAGFSQCNTNTQPVMLIQNTNTSNAPRWVKIDQSYVEAGTSANAVSITSSIELSFVNFYEASSLNGIAISGGTGIKFTASVIVNNQQSGFVITGSPSDIQIIDNDISDNGQQTTNTYDAISIANTISDYRIIGNRIGNQLLNKTNLSRYGINNGGATPANIYIIGNTSGSVGTGTLNSGCPGSGVIADSSFSCNTSSLTLGNAVRLVEGTVPIGVGGDDVLYGDSTLHGVPLNYNSSGFTNFLPKTVALTADWTCGTGGTVSSCAAATTIGSGGGVPLTFSLPLAANSLTLQCDGVVGQATGATANQWNLLTATNGATNVTASYTMATAATASAYGAVTDQASTTTTFQISPSWTLGGTGTKMPFHIWAKVEGASASGTLLSLQLVAPTVGDLVTIYRGAACTIF